MRILVRMNILWESSSKECKTYDNYNNLVPRERGKRERERGDNANKRNKLEIRGYKIRREVCLNIYHKNLS